MPTFAESFATESARLTAVLGPVTLGGFVENIAHIGATSLPEAPAGASGCVDIALAVWPFPLEAPALAALQNLGYALDPAHATAPEQRLRHASGAWQLFVTEPGSDNWLDAQLLRDYLSQDPAARQRYGAGAKTAKAEAFAILAPAARAWWVASQGFAPLEKLAQEFNDFPATWCISSGWALDLFLGQVTRVHHDVDVVIARADQLMLQQHLTQRGWQWVTPYQKRLEPWPPHMRLELPRHQAHAHRQGQFLDCLLTDFEAGFWHYRRNPVIVRAVERVRLRAFNGLSYLAPELVLLFKSVNTSDKPRPRDQSDFEQVLPHLEPERRAWLRWALLATDPNHAWLATL